MSKYEALITLTIEVDANNYDIAHKIIYGEMTDRLLETTSRDNKFKMWLDVINVDEMEEN